MTLTKPKELLTAFLCWTALSLFSGPLSAQINPVDDDVTFTDCGGGIGYSVGCSDADTVYLAFSDLISGPDTGLGDGLGDGAIVTVWGYGLGGTQGSSTVEYCDSNSDCWPAAHVYYWKNADGTLPGGPSNLFASHGMQEIAFSIPSESAAGAGTIRVTVGGSSSTLPFTVASGNIYYLAEDGDTNNNCAGTWADPCYRLGRTPSESTPSTVRGLLNGDTSNPASSPAISAGDIIYSKRTTAESCWSGGVPSQSCTTWNVRSIGDGTQVTDTDVGLIAYPGFRPIAKAGAELMSISGTGFADSASGNLVISKWDIKVGSHTAATAGSANQFNGRGIIPTLGGRSIGNRFTENSGYCFSGQGGAFVSNGNQGQGAKIYGNELDGLGCPEATRLQHTLYMSVRDSYDYTSESQPVYPEAWDISWNYLHKNELFYGIHNYDESSSSTSGTLDCADLQGTIRVTNNVVVDQWGSGINIATADRSESNAECWSSNIVVTGNLLINNGLGEYADGVSEPSAVTLGGDIGATTVEIRNNTIYGYGEATNFETSSGGSTGACFQISFGEADPAIDLSDNVCVQTLNAATRPDVQYWVFPHNPPETNLTAARNLFWNIPNQSGTNGNNAAPTLNSTAPLIGDPIYTQSGDRLSMGSGAATGVSGANPMSPVDIYGRNTSDAIGAVEN